MSRRVLQRQEFDGDIARARFRMDRPGRSSRVEVAGQEGDLDELRRTLAGAARAVAARPEPEAEALARDFRSTLRVGAPLPWVRRW